jgi:hypothetical protein
MDAALEQLFSYLVWRDTKAAILLFIRNVDITAMIEKAIDRIKAASVLQAHSADSG